MSIYRLLTYIICINIALFIDACMAYLPDDPRFRMRDRGVYTLYQGHIKQRLCQQLHTCGTAGPRIEQTSRLPSAINMLLSTYLLLWFLSRR
jgi:hypothetical protein